jgi:DNA-binding beta-propeller fold protein YncE
MVDRAIAVRVVVVHALIILTAMFVAVAGGATIRGQLPPPPPDVPGTLADGSTLLPTGWRLSPAGKHLALGDLPLNLSQSPDSRYLVVTNQGLTNPSFSVVDVPSWTVKNTMSLQTTWYGLVWSPDGAFVYASGAAQNSVQEFGFADGVLTRKRTFALPAVDDDQSFTGGLALSTNGKSLFATRVFARTLSSIDVASGQVVKTVTLPAEPYTCVVSADGQTVYVSLWGGSRVQVYRAASLTLVDDLFTDEHPNALLLSKDGNRLFVACGNGASVWTYDTRTDLAIEQISMSLFPEAPPTSTPNSLALSPDGKTLLVANADTNAVAVVDVTNGGQSLVSGFIPTGWYPTNAVFSRDGQQIFILSGKGLTPSTNMNNAGMEQRLTGTISTVPTPDRTTLAAYTRKVYALMPYTDDTRLHPAGAPIGSPIPAFVGGVSPIKHVFYVIRENRTYDSVFGDLSQGNGRPSFTLFGRDVTPNAHAIAENFVLMDNFYVDADVSYDGHDFSMAGYATDFVQKIWQTYYGHRGALYIGEGGWFMRNAFGNISAPAQGYLWDYAQRAQVSVRSYGEFAMNVPKTTLAPATVAANVPGLAGNTSPTFAAFDLSITDQSRMDAWEQEFAGYVQSGKLPRLSIIRLGNDHTNGAVPGTPTPRAMVADNDIALGRLVADISNSVYWKDSAIFVLEDDAQSGADHVDSHRSVALVASPFAKRGFVDHTFYTTTGMLRTIELVLGLPPMSLYDGAAAPMYAAFQATPNLAGFQRQIPSVDTNEKNLPSAFGAEASLRMNFTDADLTPEVELNDIIWRSVKGARSPMPPPRRSAFAPRRESGSPAADDNAGASAGDRDRDRDRDLLRDRDHDHDRR